MLIMVNFNFFFFLHYVMQENVVINKEEPEQMAFMPQDIVHLH